MTAKHPPHEPAANVPSPPCWPSGSSSGSPFRPAAAGATRAPDLQCGVNPTTDVRLRADLTCTDGFRIDPPPISSTSTWAATG